MSGLAERWNCAAVITLMVKSHKCALLHTHVAFRATQCIKNILRKKAQLMKGFNWIVLNLHQVLKFIYHTGMFFSHLRRSLLFMWINGETIIINLQTFMLKRNGQEKSISLPLLVWQSKSTPGLHVAHYTNTILIKQSRCQRGLTPY